jgi:DNA-binding MarR family transcriptional regulator
MYGIHEMHFLIAKHLEQELSARGKITFSQFLILLPPHCRDHATFQSEIAEMLHLTEATVSRHVKTLTALGYLEHHVDPSNKRKHLLLLTKKGETEFREAQQIIEQTLKAVFEGIPEKDRSLITGTFDRVVETLLARTSHLTI